MFDPEVYRDMCRELRAPQEKIEEMIAMTENNKKKFHKPLRTALALCATVAMMVVGVAAANPEGLQEFVINLGSIVRVDRYRSDVTTKDGETFSMVESPAAKVENRDGRAILVLNGEDEADITDALAQDQHYVFEDFTGDTKITITVDGTADQWVMEKEMGVVKEDGSYHWFGSEIITSEDVDDALGGIFADGAFWVTSELDKNGQGAGTDTSDVTASVTVVDEEDVAAIREKFQD